MVLNDFALGFRQLVMVNFQGDIITDQPLAIFHRDVRLRGAWLRYGVKGATGTFTFTLKSAVDATAIGSGVALTAAFDAVAGAANTFHPFAITGGFQDISQNVVIGLDVADSATTNVADMVVGLDFEFLPT